MGKSAKIGIVAGAVLLLVILLYFFGFKKSDESYLTDTWEMTYDPEDKGPYGTFMLKELLDTTGMFGNFLQLSEKLEETLEDDPDVNDIYFFVGGQNHLTDSSTQYLLDFVANGNSAFIATEQFPYELLDRLLYDRDLVFLDNEVEDSTQYFTFEHSNFKGKRYQFDFIYNNSKVLKTWHYFNSNEFFASTDGDLFPLGGNNKGLTNYIKIKHGDGLLYLHSIPYAFTNISLMKRDGFQYAENVLKHIPPGRVQWDKYNLQYHYKSNNNGNGDGNGGGEKRESILQFILDNPPLTWAFLILLIGALLYALFKGKRMQKVIPATESKENMSLQYINTLSALYLKEKRHNKLVRLIAKTFLNFIADHYYISTNKPDEKFIQRVAQKSHVPAEDIADLFASFKRLENSPHVSDDELIELHQKVEKFHKTCR